MIDVETLYNNDKFLAFVNSAISRNIKFMPTGYSNDDYINDIFVEILDSDCQNYHECKKATWRVLERGRRNLKMQPSSVLWEDNHIIGALHEA